MQLTGERLTFQLNVRLTPLLSIANRIIAHSDYNEPTSSIKARQHLAAERYSLVHFLQAIHDDMFRYRELSRLEVNINEDIASTRGYLALHDTITGQPRRELDAENQDFHDVYLHDRLLSYRGKARNKTLHKLQAERDKLKGGH